jgi:ankyrin repeat protein
LGNLDDVVIDVTTNEKQVSFAIQLKHKNNKNKRLSPETLETENGDFSLKKYCEAFKGLSDVDKQRQFILYTNAKFDPKRTAEVTNFTMIQDDCCDGNMFFNTCSDGGNVYRFEVNDKTPQKANITKSDYAIFFSRFRLFVCQKNFEDLKKDIVEILQNDTMDVVPKYLELFRNWHQGKYTNKKIEKATVNVHLIDIFLSTFITKDHYFPIGQNEKLKLFEKVIKEFDLTLVNDSFEHFKENLTDELNLDEGLEGKLKSYKEKFKIGPEASADESIMRLAREIKIIDKSVTKLENEVKQKVLQYLFEKPIIVKFNETSEKLIYKIMKLHQLGSKIKFIVVGQGIQSVRLSRFRIFKNVKDLRSNDQLYSEVTRTCRLSLQGRKETTLEVLIDSCKEICQHVGAKEVLQMLKGNFLIGQATERRLPSFYINRKVCFKVEKIHAFLDGTFVENHLAIVKFDREVGNLQNEIRKRNINVVYVHDYLKSPQISNEPTIILTNEECSEQLLQDVSQKSHNKFVVYLRISKYYDFLIISIKENQIHRLTGPVNILCADPGMGKTTLLKKLRNECDSRFWTIDVDLKTHNEFFKTKHDVDEVLNRLIEGNANNFSKHIRDVFRSKKKVYFFFDGLDEMENSCVDNVLNSVNELSCEGFHIWISSRKNLKTQLEDRFKKVAMDMEEIEEEQQKSYIRNRLKKEYNDVQVENLISKIYNNSDIDNNRQISGKVLQLYIITQNFLANKERHQKMTEDTSTFVFTKMYDWFFRGRIKHNRDKEESKNPYLFWTDLEDILEIYQHIALHSVFSEEVFRKLNVDLRRALRILNKIKMNKDPFGIVTKVNFEGKAVFQHFTYGEYFAARFFSNNFDKARLIREELFSDGHENLMMILSIILAEDNPLHLAVIYRNVDQIKKNIDNKNVHDKAGRNPLHLATYVEPRFVDRKTPFFEVYKAKYLTNIDILEKMVNFNYADRDKLFQLNALDYAFENRSFVSVEIITKTYEYAKEELHQYSKKYINNDNFMVFCLTHGCKNLLSSILENSTKNNNYIKKNASIIIQIAIENCYFQENETFRFVINTLADKYDFNVECTRYALEKTALHLAANYGKTYAVQMLLEKGASINAVTTDHETPLHLASRFGDLETVKLLIEKGAFVNTPATDNVTPLHLASIREDLKTVALLIEKGAYVNALKTNDESSLHLASGFGNLETVELLIEKGASVNAFTTDKKTPLHLASIRGDLKIVALLIDKAASVNALTTDNKTPLHLASERGDLKTVSLLIEKGASVNAVTTDNQTPLHLASKREDLKTVALLIEKGASVNALTTDNKTPLHLASERGDLKTVSLLIEKGASVNAVTTDNETPLHLASIRGDMKTVTLLIEKGASVNAVTTDNKTPIHLTSKRGDLKTVALLIEKGASVNALKTNNETPLHLASEFGNLETVELLIEKGASVNAITTDHESPLHLAFKRGDLKTVALLIEKGASVNALTTDNKSPLHLASEFGDFETVSLLIEKGASVNAVTTDNETPLHLASIRGDMKTVALLIEKGASVNAVTTGNKTPIHLTSKRGDFKTVALLIEKGASVNALKTNNETPLHLASEFGNLETVELLIEKGASVNAITTDHESPLHLAFKRGDLKTVALLIEKGASVNALTTDNKSPLHLASEFGDFETVSLLIEKGASVNAVTTDNETPLHLASKREGMKTVALLIEKGASVNTVTTDNETPLHLASRFGDLKTVSLLIEKGASINALTTDNKIPLHLASIRGDLKILALLIEKGASVNALKTNNETPLHLASERKDLKTVALLIEKGASVNALKTNDETPLHLASEFGDFETVKLLIEKGASVNALKTRNETSLHLASEFGDFQTVEILIEKGACVNAVTTDKKTPLHLASIRGDLKIVALLIEKGASVNALKTNNETPLHLAAIRGDLKTVALLIEKGASVNAVTTDNKTPLYLASKRGDLKTVSLLNENGASVNALCP